MHGEHRIEAARDSQRYDLCNWLPADIAGAVRARMVRRKLSPGQIVYMENDEGNELYRIASGEVALSIARQNGRETLYALFSEGEFFGESSLIDGLPRPHTAEARVDTVLDVLPGADFHELRERYRVIDEALLQLMTRRMRALSTSLAHTRLDELTTRVAAAIATASSALQGTASRSPRVAISQSELALMVGVSRQSVNAILHKLRCQDVIGSEYGAIVIRDQDRLAYIAEGR